MILYIYIVYTSKIYIHITYATIPSNNMQHKDDAIYIYI